MKRFILKFLILFSIAAGGLVPATIASAVTCPSGTAREGETLPSYAECSTQATDGDDSLMSRVRVIINVVLGVMGVAAVAVIILGGVTYVTSQGQPDKLAQAKNTILYAIVGLVVALLGFAIVNFVLVNVFS